MLDDGTELLGTLDDGTELLGTLDEELGTDELELGTELLELDDDEELGTSQHGSPGVCLNIPGISKTPLQSRSSFADRPKLHPPWYRLELLLLLRSSLQFQRPTLWQ